MGVKILGTGVCFPETIVQNEDFPKIVETSDEWIVKRTGIHTRRMTGQPTYVLAEEAAKNAITDAKISPEDIDLILCTTVTSDFITPSLACVVQGRIGAKNAIAYDINCACAAFVYTMDLADMYLERGYKNILLISAECLSKITNFEDRGTCVLFGDGAGACVVTKGKGGFASALGCDGTGANTLFARRPRNDIPFVEVADPQDIDHFPDATENTIYMDGREVYKFAVNAMATGVKDACEKFGITPEELDWVIPHQANIRIVQTAAKELGLSMDKFICNIAEYGNTSSACIPIALDEAVKDGRIKRGQKVCIVGFGAGLVYGGAVFEY